MVSPDLRDVRATRPAYPAVSRCTKRRYVASQRKQRIMDLSIQTHFGQYGPYSPQNTPALLDMIATSGADSVRDGLSWRMIESAPGIYDFSAPQVSYIQQMIDSGLDPVITLQPHGNLLYQGGGTVLDPEALAGFAHFVSAVLDAFPGLTRIAIGNEFNSNSSSFIVGAAANSTLVERAQIYTNIVAAVADRLSVHHPDVDLIGGAVHSVPTGYIGYLADAGAFAYIDTFDFHPYGQDPVQVAENLEELNRLFDSLPEDQRPNLIASEFGQSADLSDPLSNADYLAKMIAVMGDAGITEAVWYALLDEDMFTYGNMGLYDNLTTENDMLRGYQWLADLLDAGTPERIASVSTIELYRFTADTVLVWGSYQSVTITGTDLVFRNAAGTIIDAPNRLTDAALYVQGTDIQITPSSGAGHVIADSFYDFDLQESLRDTDSGWSYHGLRNNAAGEYVFDMSIMDGQSRNGESWNPYLGNAWARPFMMDALTLRPVEFGTQTAPDERATVERFTVTEDGAFDIVGSWAVRDAATNGVRLEIRLNDEIIHSGSFTGDIVVALRHIAVRAGDEIDFDVFANGNSTGDRTLRHIRILDADRHMTTEQLIADHVQNDVIDGNETLTANSAHVKDGSIPFDMESLEELICVMPSEPAYRLDSIFAAQSPMDTTMLDSLSAKQGADVFVFQALQDDGHSQSYGPDLIQTGADDVFFM